MINVLTATTLAKFVSGIIGFPRFVYLFLTPLTNWQFYACVVAAYARVVVKTPLACKLVIPLKLAYTLPIALANSFYDI